MYIYLMSQKIIVYKMLSSKLYFMEQKSIVALHVI